METLAITVPGGALSGTYLAIISRMPESELPTGCPPESASPCAGEVFRLVTASPPIDEDFESYFQQNPDADFGDYACEARGLSIRRNLGAAQSFLRSRRKRYKTTAWFLAIAEFTEPNGLVGKTCQHPDHYTWWPAELETCRIHFKIVEEN